MVQGVMNMANVQLNGCKIKKIDTVKDKVTIVFEGKSDELSPGGGKSLPDILKELNSISYLSLSVSVGVDTAVAPPAPPAEKKPTTDK
jgi:hypothetical protein